MKRLEDKVCLITGSGRGIGRFLAETFAAEGAALVLTSRTQEQLDLVAAELHGTFRTDILCGAVDVAAKGAMADLAEQAHDRFGKVDVVVNNAAVIGPVGALVSLDLEAWRSALMINVVGIAQTVAAFAPLIPDGGRVVNLSGAGLGGPRLPARVSAYTASKAAVVALTETLATELAPRSITVNAVAPGRQATAFMQPVVEAGAERAGAELFEDALGPGPSHDNRAPLADLVLYLVGSEGGWISGRLLSARWETPSALEARRADGMSASLFRLRRVDDDMFIEQHR